MSDRSDTIPPPYQGFDDEELEPTEELDLATLDLFEGRKLSATLPVNADRSYQTFCDIELIPRWVTMVNTVQILATNPQGRVQRAVFSAGPAGRTVDYTLEYEYRQAERVVSWWTPDQPMMRVGGRAQFSPLGDRACMMSYELYLDAPTHALTSVANPYFDSHVPSSVLADFRDFLGRINDPYQQGLVSIPR